MDVIYSKLVNKLEFSILLNSSKKSEFKVIILQRQFSYSLNTYKLSLLIDQ